MYTYFMDMCDDNSDFFYLLDTVGDNQLRNVFWADARIRAACKEFGEVVTFDATYLTNKYHMPFAPFVGVNHLGQSIILGCGLISHEDTESYSWLMRAWKSCMGCAPRAIITDQCMTMKNAIEEVFPNTQHRWCIWHIMEKVSEKFGKFGRYVSISFVFRGLVYESLTIEAFEVGWDAFIKEFGLEENKWLDGLYKERNRWVPAFVNDVFWEGMQSTQRSESMNSYFDGYIHEKTTLKIFVEQYENALATKVTIEANADLNCSQSFILAVIEDDIEAQFQNVYTNANVQEFQKIFLESLHVRCTKKEEVMISGTILRSCLFPVKFELVKCGEDKRKKRCLFPVKFDCVTMETKCGCCLFESCGIVCTHQLMVWAHMRVRNAPEKYVLRRWRKDVTRVHEKIPGDMERIIMALPRSI